MNRVFSKTKSQRCKNKRSIRYIGETPKTASCENNPKRDTLHKASFGKYDLSPLRKLSLRLALYLVLAALAIWFIWESISAIGIF